MNQVWQRERNIITSASFFRGGEDPCLELLEEMVKPSDQKTCNFKCNFKLNMYLADGYLLLSHMLTC